MKTWTKHQVITYTILLTLLVVNFSQSLMVLIYEDLHIQTDALRFWTILLYGLILFGGFPLIMVVVRLNQDDLQKLNMDKFYVFMLIIAGLIGLYTLPYNFFAGIAVIYAIYILFGNKISSGIADPNTLRIILLIMGVFTGTVICSSLASTTNVDLLQSEQWMRKFVVETIPNSIYEEAVYRGMLYMFLKDLGFSESKVLYTQAFLFWITHINLIISSPFAFWVIGPILSLILGYLTVRSKSLTPSTIAHLLYNAFVGFSRLVS